MNFFARVPSFGLLMDTFANSATPLMSFTLVFFIVFWGFSQAHTMLFGKTVASYRSIELSMWTLLRAMLGDFNFDEMFSANRFLGPVFFFTYIVGKFELVSLITYTWDPGMTCAIRCLPVSLSSTVFPVTSGSTHHFERRHCDHRRCM